MIMKVIGFIILFIVAINLLWMGLVLITTDWREDKRQSNMYPLDEFDIEREKLK